MPEMIKLRVEWHHKCPKCGTEVVADFFSDAEDICTCLWCGFLDQSACDAHRSDLQEYIIKAASELECQANLWPGAKY